jgi:hypothetical protein
MLAYQVIEVRVAVCGYMAVGTGGAEGAVALQVSFAYWTRGRYAMAIGFEEEGGECEGIGWSLVFEDLT